MTPDILSPEFSENPFPVLELMRNEYPVYFHEAMNSYMISRYEDVERAFKDPAFNSNNYEWQLEPVHGPTILQMEGRDHSRHRNLVTPAFRGIDGERLSDIDVKAFVSLLLTAGGETTDKSMANMFWRLIEHPEQMEAVRADRSLIRNAFAETLRHTPPVQMIMRETATDVEMSGGTIPAGATVTCLLAGANRDPRKYDDPDRFDIFREDLDMEKAFTAAANHTSFALGRHFCVGAILALTEVETGTNQVLDAMEHIDFVDGPPTPVGVFTRSPVHMPLTFRPAA